MGYIRRKAVVYGEQFYPIQFQINYLEDIRSGANIRYKGGLIIGKVDSIKIKNKHFVIKAHIANEFKIPKTSSRVTLKTWGYFGPKYINIDIFIKNKEHLEGLEYYKKNDVIFIEDVVNFTIMMDKFAHAIENNEHNKMILEIKLNEIKKMVKSMRYKSGTTRFDIKKGKLKEKIIKNIQNMLRISENIFQIIRELDQFNYDVTIELKKKIPDLKKSIRYWHELTKYNEQSEYFGFMHGETTYERMLQYIKEINGKLKIYKRKPYRMIFDG